MSEQPTGIRFSLYACRFRFLCIDPLHFAEGKSGNILRGAMGDVLRRLVCSPDCPGAKVCPERLGCPYARLFEPTTWGSGPSGLADWPRPFVLRTSHLDGQALQPGATFEFDLHLFDMHEGAMPWLILTFHQLAQEGIGRRRRLRLETVDGLDRDGRAVPLVRDDRIPSSPGRPPPVVLSLDPLTEPVSKVRVQFATPTELKFAGRIVREPQFGILFARIRDRISTLRALYGEGPLEIDFRAMAERANQVKLTGLRLESIEVERRSGKTGLTHPLGGFVGEAEYTGDLSEFVPYLKAAWWAGVGRQTVWGKGAIKVLEVG